MTRMIERWFPCADSQREQQRWLGKRKHRTKPFHMVRRPTHSSGEGRRDLFPCSLGQMTKPSNRNSKLSSKKQ